MGESAVANDAADALGSERMFVGYAGQTVELVDGAQGRDQTGAGSVAVMAHPATFYAEASRTQTLPDWIGSQVCAGFHGAPSRASSIGIARGQY